MWAIMKKIYIFKVFINAIFTLSVAIIPKFRLEEEVTEDVLFYFYFSTTLNKHI